MAEDDYLLSGFEKKPGRHPLQGEHAGKWLHAATLAYEQTHDEKLLKSQQDAVARLLATQEPDGYLGTYGRDYRFTAMPENVRLSDIADDYIHHYPEILDLKVAAQSGTCDVVGCRIGDPLR